MATRGLPHVTKSFPLPSLVNESDSLLLKYTVYRRIVNFIKHVHSQDMSTNISNQIFSEQLSNNLLRNFKISTKICGELRVYGIFDQNMSKKQLKILVREACQKANDAEIYTQTLSYEKMAAVKDKISKGNSYFFIDKSTNVKTLF